MLDDDLVLLDGTEVLSLRAVTKMLGHRATADALDDLERAGVRPETVLDGQAYFGVDHIAPLIAGR